jgi:RNA 2',3'-cyclic 3'-phosphodiesterase
MKKRKIFIEISIPQQLKKKLVQKTEKWSDLPVKWAKEENLHITLSFVGYVDESVLPDICQKVKETANNLESFEIVFDSIEFLPDKENPRLIGFVGQPSQELGKLNEAVEKAIGMLSQKHKKFRPHITLGRIRKLKWDALSEKPIIEEKFNVAMTVDSIFVMESKNGSTEYVSLEECPLL